MNPLTTLEMARLDSEERRRQADAWRVAHPVARQRLRVRLGAALQRLGARLEGTCETASAMPHHQPATKLH